jgi:peroxiredoxin family protein
VSREARAFSRVAIIIRDDAFDRLVPPLTYAWKMGNMGIQVDMLFVLDAVRVLTREGAEEVHVDPRHAHREGWLRQRFETKAPSFHECLKALHETGHVRLFGCLVGAETHDIRIRELLPEVEGIVDPDVFMNEFADQADHCQYF